MIINTIPTTQCQPQTIVIGRRGTYDTMQIAFDLSYLVESYGNGVAVLAVKRSQDESAYPAIVTQEDATLLWIVNETDTAYVGSGECQLMWYVDGGLAKTIIYPMVVMRDILQTAEQPPDGYENWIEHLTELGAETQQNAQNAAQSASDAEQSATDAGAAKDAANEAVLHYPKIENGYWYVWDVTAQAYQNTNIKAEGDDGYSTEVTITSIEGGHRITITDKDHPQGQSFDVLDGQGGGGTSDYTDLTNKPQINGHTLTGNQTAEQLDLATPSDIPTDAGDIEYDESATYQAGSVGAELQEQTRQLSDIEENQIPELKNAIGQKAPLIINSASGDIASFPDGADDMPIKSLVASIEPVQDLHGYANPWPGGGGRNLLFVDSRVSQTTAGVTYTSDDDFIYLNGTKNGQGYAILSMLTIALEPGTYYVRAFALGGTTSNTVGAYGNDGTSDVTGDIFGQERTFVVSTAMTLSFRILISADGTVLTNYKIGIVVSKTSGIDKFYPYSNECPISGHTGADIEQTGKNLAKAFYRCYFYSSNQTPIFDNDSESILFYAKQGETYIISSTPAHNRDSLALVDVENVAAQTPIMSYSSASGGIWVAKWTGWTLWYGYGSKSTDFEETAQVELGSTATDYEPYTGNQISVNWEDEAGTVYGGTLTLNSNGTVELNDLWIKPNITGWDLNSTMASGYKLYRALTSGPLYYSNSYGGEFRCNITSIARNIPSNIDYTCVQLPVQSARYLWAVVPPDYDFSDFEIVYKVYEPDVMPSYAIAANQITTLYGTNNIWSSTGDTEVTYPADTKLYIDGKLAELQATILENIGG